MSNECTLDDGTVLSMEEWIVTIFGPGTFPAENITTSPEEDYNRAMEIVDGEKRSD